MTTSSSPLPDGEIFAMSDRLLLVDEMESIAASGWVLGRAGTELAIHITFQGRINRATERSDITIALSPVDAMGLVDMILHSAEAITRAQETGR